MRELAARVARQLNEKINESLPPECRRCPNLKRVTSTQDSPTDYVRLVTQRAYCGFVGDSEGCRRVAHYEHMAVRGGVRADMNISHLAMLEGLSGTTLTDVPKSPRQQPVTNSNWATW
jgi:hypothetical protein